MPEASFLQGDCLEVLPTLPKGSVDMVFCDLPYNCDGYHPTNCAWDKQVEIQGLWRVLLRAGKLAAPIVFTASSPFTSSLIESNRQLFKATLVWDKGVPGNFMHAARHFMRWHEDIVVFARSCFVFNPQMEKRDKPLYSTKKPAAASESGGVRRPQAQKKTYTDRYPSSILRFSTRNQSRGLHPTQKPVELLRYLIRTYSNPGDTVLDPTAGSGTTAVAALLEGRNSISIEKDPTIFANAKERVMAVQRSLRPKSAS